MGEFFRSAVTDLFTSSGLGTRMCFSASIIRKAGEFGVSSAERSADKCVPKPEKFSGNGNSMVKIDY